MSDAKPFHIKLTAEQRQRLDEHRAALGLRSEADVIRFWIAEPVVNAAVWKAGDVAEPHRGRNSPEFLAKLDREYDAAFAQPVAPQARRSTKASVGGRTGASAESASRPTEPLVQLGPAPVTPGSRLKGGKK